MGATRQKKLRMANRELNLTLDAERALHKETVAMLDALRQAAAPSRAKINWYESCFEEYRRLRELGIIKDPF